MFHHCVPNSSLSSPLTFSVQTDYAVNVITILRDFGPGGLLQELLAEVGVHGLVNLLSLEPIPRSMFDNLDLWLEGADEVYYP